MKRSSIYYHQCNLGPLDFDHAWRASPGRHHRDVRKVYKHYPPKHSPAARFSATAGGITINAESTIADDRQWTQALADFSAAIDQRDGDQRMARTYGMHFIDYFPSRELGILYFENGRYGKPKRCWNDP